MQAILLKLTIPSTKDAEAKFRGITDNVAIDCEYSENMLTHLQRSPSVLGYKRHPLSRNRSIAMPPNLGLNEPTVALPSVMKA